MEDNQQTELLIRLDERTQQIFKNTQELHKIIKGDNGSGLMSKFASMKASVSWLTWGFRGIYVSVVGLLFFWIKSHL